MTLEKKIKVMFVIPSLVAGGSERMISFISQNIDKSKFDPILLVAGFEKDSVYDTKNIKVIYLNKNRILKAIPTIIWNLLIHKPQIVLSSIAHLNTAMALISPFFHNIKFIGREATVLSKRSHEKKGRNWSPIEAFPHSFGKLDALICQSQDMADDMFTNFKVPKNKIYVINNPISNLPTLKNQETNGIIKKFITVGRLTEVKGHIRLLNILSKFTQPFIYTIIGDGELKEVIFQKAKDLKIDKHIKYINYTNEVNKYIADNDIFLQGSYVEGFPNALLESCVVGTPVIAFDVAGGTKEILVDGVNGFLVSDEQEFLDKLYDDRKWSPRTIRNSVYEKFNKEKIIKQYEHLFIHLLTKK